MAVDTGKGVAMSRKSVTEIGDTGMSIRDPILVTGAAGRVGAGNGSSLPATLNVFLLIATDWLES